MESWSAARYGRHTIAFSTIHRSFCTAGRSSSTSTQSTVVAPRSEISHRLPGRRTALFRQHSSEVHGFVGSLTSEGDLLSQWRGYNRGQGFSIGFSADWLLQNAAAQDFDITPVLYDTEQQRAAADRAVTLLIGRLVEGTDEPEGARAQVRTWWPHALKTALVLKNQHFQEERESRLVWVGVSWPGDLKTRVSPAGLVPYRACQFDKVVINNNAALHPNNCGIEEIIIGPALGDSKQSPWKRCWPHIVCA
ncbi:hypothetical protein ACVWYH_001846 [Bradyrhizobium sp. GM24.11]